MDIDEIRNRLKDGWLLYVDREFETNFDDDIFCLGIETVELVKEGEADIPLTSDVFYVIEGDLILVKKELLCSEWYTLEGYGVELDSY